MAYFWRMDADNLMGDKIRLPGGNGHTDICAGDDRTDICVISVDQTAGYV